MVVVALDHDQLGVLRLLEQALNLLVGFQALMLKLVVAFSVVVALDHVQLEVNLL